jgi:heat shock protein HslJ
MFLSAAAGRAGTALLVVAAASGCQPRPEEAAPKPLRLAESAQIINLSAPTLQELKNATYRGVEEAGVSLTLADGKWEGQPFASGSASRPSVTFVRDFRLNGDVDGDGAEEAVVLLGASAGGTGEMSYLAVVGRRGGKAANIATASIGDRVQLRNGRIDGRRIVLDVVQAGERDAACCPGDLVTRNWELDAGALKEGAPVKTGRLSIDTLSGSGWVLRSWAWDEAAPATPEVTLTFDGNRLAGTAGCNNYFAQLKAGGAPGDLTVGPAGATRKLCPDATMAVEARFLRQLAGVTQMRFVAGQLVLPYARPDKTVGVMLFSRRAVE